MLSNIMLRATFYLLFPLFMIFCNVSFYRHLYEQRYLYLLCLVYFGQTPGNSDAQYVVALYEKHRLQTTFKITWKLFPN